MKDGLEDLLSFNSSMGAIEENDSKEDKLSMKDLDLFFLLKRSSNFLFSNFLLRIETLFFELIVFFLRSLGFLNLDSSEVKIADKGNLHQSR